MSERRHERFNTRNPDPPLEAEGAPPEEGLSNARIDEDLDTDPEEAPNATDEDRPAP